MIYKIIFYLRNRIKVDNGNEIINYWKNKVRNSKMTLRGNNHKIVVGKNCMFSRNIKLMASDGHKIYCDNKLLKTDGNIEIGDNIWIADNVTILKNIKIKNGSIIGINSLVTKSIEKENVLIVGNPAKIVKENIKWEK